MVVKALDDVFSGHKKPELQAKKGDSLGVISDHGNVLIVQSKHGRFSIKKSKTQEIMIASPQELISKIKEVDCRLSYTFPVCFVTGITENKPWEQEFIELLKKSDLRNSLKTEILKAYDNA